MDKTCFYLIIERLYNDFFYVIYHPRYETRSYRRIGISEIHKR